MAVNQQRRAAKLIKARVKAKERRKQRESQPNVPPRSLSGLELFDRLEFGDSTGDPNGSEMFGLQKMSDVLLELVDPLNPGDLEPDKLLRLAQVGSMAWNLTVIPESSRREMIQQAIRMLPPDGDLILEVLIERKLRLFPDDTRFVMDVVMKDNGRGGTTLLALSALDPPDERR